MAHQNKGITLQDLKKLFHNFDKDNDGHITQTELSEGIKAMYGHKVKAGEIKQCMKKYDADGNGNIDFEEFVQVMSFTQKKDKEMRDAFKIFDHNEDGLICKDDLLHQMKYLGENISEKDVLEMIRKADQNSDGKIDFEEFVEFMTEADQQEEKQQV